MNAYVYLFTAVLLLLSFWKDKSKTRKALMKAWKSFDNILPQILVVFLVVGVMLAVVNPEMITSMIGAESGLPGVALAAVVGAVTLIPGFIAFPTAAMLLQGGAGYMQIGAFISALMMVGIVTMPVEIKYFGKKLTFYRNAMGFLFSFIVAYIIGWVVNGI